MMGNGLKGLAAILAINRSGGFTPEVMFEEIIAHKLRNMQVMDQPEVQLSGLIPSKINKIHNRSR